jgi:NitT/TauT family transport system ATP-binding protein
VLLSRRPGRVSQIIEPKIDRTASPDAIRRDQGYLDTVEEIWQGLKHYVD